MPFLVKVEVKDSPMHGKGVFALEDIAEGTVCWIAGCQESIPVQGHLAEENKIYTKQQLEALPADKLKVLLFGGIYLQDQDVFLEILDGSQFTNHSLTPTTLISFPSSKDFREVKSLAARDIKRGEEITESYLNYPAKQSGWLPDLLRKYCSESLEFDESIENTRKNL